MSELHTLDSLIKKYCDKINELELKISSIEEFGISTGIFNLANSNTNMHPPVKLTKDKCKKFYTILKK